MSFYWFKIFYDKLDFTASILQGHSPTAKKPHDQLHLI